MSSTALATHVPRSCQNFLYRPVGDASAAQRPGFHAQTVCPLIDVQTQSIESQINTITPIQGLFSRRLPSAVFFAVRPIVVETIDAASVGWHPHICKKILKQIPSLTNCNPATPVINVTAQSWISTSRFHASPYVVNPRMLFSYGLHLLLLRSRFPVDAAPAVSAL